jgi:hypothetical protein
MAMAMDRFMFLPSATRRIEDMGLNFFCGSNISRETFSSSLAEKIE